MRADKMEALVLAATLPLNETVNGTCPICDGHLKFSVTRTREGVLWNCYRAGCDARGSSITQGELVPAAKPRSNLRPYRGALYGLWEVDREYFRDRFGLTVQRSEIQITEDNRYAMAVRTPDRKCRGYSLRAEWSGHPSTPRSCKAAVPKNKLHMHAEGPTIAWYPAGSQQLVLVEDQLSAMRAEQAGVSACALLGVDLNADKVREIAMQRPQEVLIALDSDATDTAFQLARKWGLAFKKTRVVVLERDLKDEPRESSISDILGVTA